MRRIMTDVPHGLGWSGKWNVAITDMSDAAAWNDELRNRCSTYGNPFHHADGMTPQGITNALRDGDMEMASASERFMQSFADMSFNGRRFGTIAAVAGGAPNVGAHLAGSPIAMRRRERVMSDMGPLTIFVDGSSSGSVGTEQLKRRGAALLGLVRMLQAVRPINLYVVGGGMPNARLKLTCSVFVKIEGTLDLSRDGFAVGHPAFTRLLLYRACADLDTESYNGMLAWEFGGAERYRHFALGAFCKVFGCDPSEAIFFSPPTHNDPVIDDPVKWIRDMLVKYGGQTGVRV